MVFLRQAIVYMGHREVLEQKMIQLEPFRHLLDIKNGGFGMAG